MPSKTELVIIPQWEQLEKDLQAVTRQYTKSDVKPPFSMPEMLVMGIVLGKRDGMTLNGLHYWLLDYFGYYRNATLRIASGLSNSLSEACRTLKFDISVALSDLDAPLFRAEMPFHEDDSDRWSAGNGGRWVVESPSAARGYLHRVLTERSQTHFRLMDLPVEPRLRIYDYALSLPKSGVQVETRRFGHANLRVFSKDYDRGHIRVCQMTAYFLPRSLSAPASTAHLELFQVSKAVYGEAMPVFFENNLFVRDDTVDLSEFLHRTSEARREHIRKIAFCLTGKPSSAPTAFEMLSSLLRLKELDVWINEDDYKTEKKGLVGLPGYYISGFPALRAVRGLKAVRFHGNCEVVKAALEGEMTKPKVEKKLTTRERKAVGSTTGTAKGKKAKATESDSN
ncbi:hypothetical protein Slin14017_G109650 [Septoria linicola]|nr:hypothetical protein Slin14017_G109650 [Septoria linicola]